MATPWACPANHVASRAIATKACTSLGAASWQDVDHLESKDQRFPQGIRWDWGGTEWLEGRRHPQSTTVLSCWPWYSEAHFRGGIGFDLHHVQPRYLEQIPPCHGTSWQDWTGSRPWQNEIHSVLRCCEWSKRPASSHLLLLFEYPAQPSLTVPSADSRYTLPSWRCPL